MEAKSDRWPGVLARDCKGENRAVIWPLWTAHRMTCRELQHRMLLLLRPKHQKQNSVSSVFVPLCTMLSLLRPEIRSDEEKKLKFILNCVHLSDVKRF